MATKEESFISYDCDDGEDLKRENKKRKLNEDFLKRLEFIIEEMEQVVAKESLENGHSFVGDVHVLIRSLKYSMPLLYAFEWKLILLNISGMWSLVRSVIPENLVNDAMDIYRNVRVKKGYKKVSILPVPFTADGKWHISVDWPEREMSEDIETMLKKFDAPAVCNELKQLPELAINDIMARKINQLMVSFKRVKVEIEDKHPDCEILQIDYQKDLKKAKGSLEDCMIRIDHMTDDAIIKNLPGIGKVTLGRIQCVLHNGIRDKVWKCSYKKPHKSGDKITIEMNYE